MNKSRLEAFSDGVIAIIITIMVLELKIPHGDNLAALEPLLPVFLSYILSFIYLGIYWINHHHLLGSAGKISGGTLWANLNLLFWLSLIPFATGWMGENHFAKLPTALYGFVLLCAAISFVLLQHLLIKNQGKDGEIAKAVGNDFKAKISIGFYVISIPLAFYNQYLADACYIIVAAIWLVPDKRLEGIINK